LPVSIGYTTIKVFSGLQEEMMGKFRGTGHIPGAPGAWEVELEADWEKKEFIVHIPESGAKVTEFPGLMVQTIGTDEAVFRTRGIPTLQIHWWHVIKAPENNLWAMVLALPDESGTWRYCNLKLLRL
jgi:hypothetical protein